MPDDVRAAHHEDDMGQTPIPVPVPMPVAAQQVEASAPAPQMPGEILDDAEYVHVSTTSQRVPFALTPVSEADAKASLVARGEEMGDEGLFVAIPTTYDDEKPPYDWQHLVTPGHCRVSRLREIRTKALIGGTACALVMAVLWWHAQSESTRALISRYSPLRIAGTVIDSTISAMTPAILTDIMQMTGKSPAKNQPLPNSYATNPQAALTKPRSGTDVEHALMPSEVASIAAKPVEAELEDVDDIDAIPNLSPADRQRLEGLEARLHSLQQQFRVLQTPDAYASVEKAERDLAKERQRILNAGKQPAQQSAAAGSPLGWAWPYKEGAPSVSQWLAPKIPLASERRLTAAGVEVFQARSTPVSEANKASLATPDAVVEFVGGAIASLTKTGKIEGARTLTPDEFWLGYWPVGEAVTVGSGDVRLVGMLSLNDQGQVMPLVIALRNAGKAWRAYAVEMSKGSKPPYMQDIPVVSALHIPAAVAATLPELPSESVEKVGTIQPLEQKGKMEPASAKAAVDAVLAALSAGKALPDNVAEVGEFVFWMRPWGKEVAVSKVKGHTLIGVATSAGTVVAVAQKAKDGAMSAVQVIGKPEIGLTRHSPLLQRAALLETQPDEAHVQKFFDAYDRMIGAYSRALRSPNVVPAALPSVVLSEVAKALASGTTMPERIGDAKVEVEKEPAHVWGIGLTDQQVAQLRPQVVVLPQIPEKAESGKPTEKRALVAGLDKYGATVSWLGLVAVDATGAAMTFVLNRPGNMPNGPQVNADVYDKSIPLLGVDEAGVDEILMQFAPSKKTLTRVAGGK